MYPSIKPHLDGMLDTGDAGNSVYWEECGNPDGTPVVVLHGGPGSGCTPEHRRLFDPSAYRIVLFDQRQCGRSVPHAGDPSVSVETNSTHALIADIERLRVDRGVQRWVVYGNSWGSTLALAYAETHPERVRSIVLLAVTMSRPVEIDWLYGGAGRFYPEAWNRLREGLDGDARGRDLVAAYRRLLDKGDHEAARRWCAWDEAVAGRGPQPRYDDSRFRMCFARIMTHYFANEAWLEDGILLRNADRLRGIPGVLIHGRLDVGGPLITAWELASQWPDAELVVVEGAGHGGDVLKTHVVKAMDAFRSAI